MRPHPLLFLSLGLLGAGEPAAQAQEIKELATLKEAFGPVAFSPDGKFLATTTRSAAREPGIMFWEVATWKGYRGFDKVYFPVAFSPDGKLLAALRGNGVAVLDVATQKETVGILGARGSVYPVTFSSDGKTLATVEVDDGLDSQVEFGIKLWDVATGKERARPGGKEMPAVTVKMDWRKRLFTVTGEKVSLRDIADGKIRANLSTSRGEALHELFNPREVTTADGKFEAWALPLEKGWFSAGDKVELLNKETKKERILKGHDDIRCLAFAPDGTKLASGGADGTVELWEVPSGKLLGTIEGPLLEKDKRGMVKTFIAGGRSYFGNYLAFSPDGKMVILGTVQGFPLDSDGMGMKIWDLSKLPGKKPEK
jgi:WD40 repeat protein